MKPWRSGSEKECGSDMDREKVVKCKREVVRPDLIRWVCW